MKRIGVLGGGQLGTMLAGAIHNLGAAACIYEPDAEAPACARFREVVNAPWTDESALIPFFASCDAVTYEMEHIDTAALKSASFQGKLSPSVRVLETTQDRAREKEFLKEAGLPHVKFAVIRGQNELRARASEFAFPFIVKTVRGGYDGKGQTFVANAHDLETTIQSLQDDAPRILEDAIDLALEASCIVGRSRTGEEVVFPVFENVHSGHILDLTVFPARIPDALAIKLQRIALDAARALDVHGLLTTEFFIARAGADHTDARIYVNEFAPRPHNSGHVTRNACTASQYDVLARILLGVPITPPLLTSPGTFCMGNLLGDVWLAQGKSELNLSRLRDFPEVIDVVLYGKRHAKARRKMGHYVTFSDDPARAIASARAFRQSLMDAP